MILIRATQLTFFATFCGVNEKKKDKIYNVSIYKRLVLMSLHVLLQTIPASVVCAREGRGKGDYGARERARNMVLDLNG